MKSMENEAGAISGPVGVMDAPDGARPRRTDAGWSLLESVIAMTLLSLTIVGIATVVTASFTLVSVNRETATALEAGRRVVERMAAAVPFPSVFAAYNDSTADDPPGMTCPGPAFTVAGLGAPGAQGGGGSGMITFPVLEGAGTELREDVYDFDLGLPRDLDLDGQVDAEDHSSDYRILPVTVRLSWKGVTGERATVYRTLLTPR